MLSAGIVAPRLTSPYPLPQMGEETDQTGRGGPLARDVVWDNPMPWQKGVAPLRFPSYDWDRGPCKGLVCGGELDGG